MEQQQIAAGLDGWLRRRPVLVDALFAAGLAAVLGISSGTLLWTASWPPAGRVAVLATLALAHAAVGLRRVAPLTGYAIVCAAMLVLVAVPDIAQPSPASLTGELVPPILLPSALVFPVLLYAVAA